MNYYMITMLKMKTTCSGLATLRIFSDGQYHYHGSSQSTYTYRALQPPVHKPSWYCCIRVINSNKLVGFISGVPAAVSVKGQ